MRNKYIAMILVITALAAGILFFLNINRKGRADTVEINGNIIPVEIAADPRSQVQGLSDRARLDKGTGMLFVFPQKQVLNFWMKDMNFPLDIIWISDDRIVKIDRDLPPAGPQPTTTYGSGDAVNYVLEVNAGYAQNNGINPGDLVKFNYQ